MNQPNGPIGRPIPPPRKLVHQAEARDLMRRAFHAGAQLDSFLPDEAYDEAFDAWLVEECERTNPVRG